MLIAPGIALAHLGVLLQQVDCPHQQVVEVQRVARQKQLLIAPINPCNDFIPVGLDQIIVWEDKLVLGL